MYLGRHPVSSKISSNVAVVFFAKLKRCFIFNAWPWIRGTNITRSPLSLGRKGVSRMIGSAADSFQR